MIKAASALRKVADTKFLSLGKPKKDKPEYTSDTLLR